MANKPPLSRDFYVIAHNIRSLHNVGAIFRTADAFGVSKIFLTGYTGTPESLHREKIAKVALGAESWVPWQYYQTCRKAVLPLKRKGVLVVGLENNLPGKRTVPLPEFRPEFPLALLLGEEVGGINQKLLPLCDQLLEIPMHGTKESLNLSVAFGVAAYAISQYLPG